jgi:hypothetical protein
VNVKDAVEPKKYKVGDVVKLKGSADVDIAYKVGTVTRDEDEDGIIKIDIVLTTYVHKSRVETWAGCEETRNLV